MRITLVLAAACLVLTGCATTPSQQLPAASQVQYQLGPGDKLKIVVYRFDEVSGDYVVDGNGTVTLPLAGTFDATGKTVEEFQAQIAGELARTLVKDARVTVTVTAFRPFYVLGEVNEPGEFDYQPGMTVYAAVAKAGGFTYRANRRKAFVRHQSDTEETAYALSSGAAVLPGDTIRITDRPF